MNKPINDRFVLRLQCEANARYRIDADILDVCFTVRGNVVHVRETVNGNGICNERMGLSKALAYWYSCQEEDYAPV